MYEKTFVHIYDKYAAVITYNNIGSFVLSITLNIINSKTYRQHVLIDNSFGIR